MISPQLLKEVQDVLSEQHVDDVYLAKAVLLAKTLIDRDIHIARHVLDHIHAVLTK